MDDEIICFQGASESLKCLASLTSAVFAVSNAMWAGQGCL